jgi:hypothetical protein
MSSTTTGAGGNGQATQPSGERGQRRRPKGGGGRGNAHTERPPEQPAAPKFIGKEDGLGNEYVYQLTTGNEASDQYAKTTEEIIRYLSTKYKRGGDVERSLADGTMMSTPIPTVPTGATVNNVVMAPADAAMQVWKMQVNMVLQRQALLESNLESAYALIRGQCSDAILEKVKAQDNYTAMHQDRNPIKLLQLLKSVMYQYNSRKYRAMAIIGLIGPTIVVQTRFMTDSVYLEKFRTKLSVLESAGGSITSHPGMTADELRATGIAPEQATGAETASASAAGAARIEAALFLMKSDHHRYGRLLQELANDYNKGRDSYPRTLTEAYELMLHDIRDEDNKSHPHGNGGMAFNTNGTVATKGGHASRPTDGVVTASSSQPNPRPDIRCNRCQKTGHFSSRCEETTTADGTTLYMEGSLGDANTPAVAESGTAHATVRFDNDDGVEEHFEFVNSGKVERLGDAMLLGQHKAATGRVVPSWWILLDNQSTVDVFSNKSLLCNIRKSSVSCRISCNAGVVITDLIGDLPGYPNPVWYHPQGIANILSLHRVGKSCRIQYDNEVSDAAFRVTKPDGTFRDFKPSVSGLHYCDTREHGTVLVNTVAERKGKYTARAYQQAVLARRIQNIIGRPSTRDYIKIVDGGMLQNCPITKSDIATAEDIFGPNLGSIKGKTVRRKNGHVPSLVADIPYHIIKAHKDVALSFDIMFVNKIAFLVTVSRSLRFGTTDRLASRHADVVGKSLARVIMFYKQRGFRVKECHGDGEFESLRGDVADSGAQLNVTSEDEHVPEVERYIRTLKERARAAHNTVPFKRMPGVMIVELVHASNYWLNMFPANDGVSATQSPRRIMTGQVGDYKIHGQLQFGEYAQVHESHDNSMASRTTGAIALRPTGNVQGGYCFMSLSSGKRLNRYAWTSLPMPGEVIDRVHALARRNPAGGEIAFGWRDGTEVLDDVEDEDDLHDEDYVPDEDSSSSEGGTSYGDSDDDDPDLDRDDHEAYGILPPPGTGGVEAVNETNGNDEHADAGATGDEAHAENNDQEEFDNANPDNANAENNDHEEFDNAVADDKPTDIAEIEEAVEGVGAKEVGPPPAVVTGVAADMDAAYGCRRRAGMRTRKNPRSPNMIKEPQSAAHHALNAIIGHELDGMPSVLEHTMMTQYSLKRGLAIYGEAASNAVLKEMKQLHDRKTIRPCHSSKLSLEEKRKALAYLMFIKEKRCGTIKGRGCADGRKQRLYKTKEETSSPTVRTESLLLSCLIDAKERRNVIMCDVPGAFMQVDVDEVVHVRIEGPLAELLAKVDPDTYSKYLVKERGKTVMYVQLQRALYGTLTAAMLFWKDLCGHLTAEGFTPNPYDSCVMNKMVSGKQCTVLWHVDDLKVSHVDKEVNEDVLAALNRMYGQETPLTVTYGDLHDYLGMTIDYSEDGKVAIRMEDYIESMLEDVPADMTGNASTPAADHLFKTNDEAEALPQDMSDTFHSITAKILFLCKRARPDVQTPVAFLCTRVQHPDVDDYKKLGRLVCYLRNTKELCLTLEADDLSVIRWWVDASFAVHQNMRSHTGGALSLGKGAIYSTSTCQKLNTKSSTETELVAADDVLPMILWTRQFMEGQGYAVKENVLYQDNQSAMLLEMNGQKSSTKRTRHLDIRYFFITDRIRQKQLSVEYCPTGDMWADIHTKPLQGATFAKFRKLILNLPDGQRIRSGHAAAMG